MNRLHCHLLYAITPALLFLCGCSDWREEPVPVQATVRESWVGKGYVVRFHNEAGRRLVLTIEVTDRGKANKRASTLSLPADSVKEIGWMEGWRFASGDSVLISHEGYRSRRYEVP